MIIEVARITVAAGKNTEFEAAVAKAVAVFRQGKGCLGLLLQRGIEQPDDYEVIIRWETLQDHTEGFRNSHLFQEWRALVGPYFATPPTVSHFEIAMPRVDFGKDAGLVQERTDV